MHDAKNVIDLFRIQSLADHPPQHQKVLLKCAELVEEAVRLEPPFDRVKHTKLWSRTRYQALEKLGPREKELILDAMTATAKFDSCGEAFRNQELMKRLRAFDASLRSRDELLRRTAEFAKLPPRDPHLHEEGIVLDVMKRRYPDFNRNDGPLEWVKPKPQGTYCFARSLTSTSKLLIFVEADLGISTFFEIGIGISDPFYPVRDGAPWAVTGYWPYRDAQECRQALNDAMDVIAIILQPFADKMLEAHS
jgi:hypothetical protein